MNNIKISLIGYMGSGKTSTGRLISEKMNLDFFDLDEEIEKKHQKTISEIFQKNGQIKFRKIEKEMLNELLNSDKSMVLSLGGGTPAYYDNMDVINKHSVSFYLRHNLKTLSDRLINQKENRPLIAHLNSEEMNEFIAKHLFERRNFYEKANYIINASDKDINKLSEEIIRLLHQT